MVYAARKALQNSAGAKVYLKAYIINGQKTFWRPARNGWQAILFAKPTQLKSKDYDQRPAS